MAKQNEVIGEKYYESTSSRHYRKIGNHRYRFTYRKQYDGTIEIDAEKAVANRQWEPVHIWYGKAKK